MIPERAESEMSQTTSFLAGARVSRTNRFPFTDTSDRPFHASSKWGSLPYTDAE